MPIKLNTASGGGVILTGANTASDKTITVPAVDGTMITTASTFAGTGPAFSALVVGTFSISAATWTKLQLNTEQFDTNSNFDSTTNFRFTPTVSGYYQLNGGNQQLFNGVNYLAIYKNGSLTFQFGGATTAPTLSCLVYLNGSTDYIELYVYSASAVTSVAASSPYVFMSGFLARAA